MLAELSFYVRYLNILFITLVELKFLFNCSKMENIFISKK